MKEKLLLVGAGGFGRVVAEYTIENYDCAFVDDSITLGTVICGVPVVGKISDLPVLRKQYSNLIVVIGNNKLRYSVYKQAMGLGYWFPSVICKSAYISPYAKIGWGCVLLNNVVVQNGARVGNGVLLNSGVEIHHDSYVDDYVLIYANSVVRTGAKVGKRVRIGSNITISNSCIISDDKDLNN